QGQVRCHKQPLLIAHIAQIPNPSPISHEPILRNISKFPYIRRSSTASVGPKQNFRSSADGSSGKPCGRKPPRQPVPTKRVVHNTHSTERFTLTSTPSPQSHPPKPTSGSFTHK